MTAAPRISARVIGLSAQRHLLEYAVVDFANAFNARSPDMGAKA